VKSTYDPIAPARPAAPHVTRRQLEILRLIADGHNDHQIGERLQISHHTVRLHNSAMYAALEATGRAHARGDRLPHRPTQIDRRWPIVARR
jgi:DNA-binding NarL/FixJ family response regulator